MINVRKYLKDRKTAEEKPKDEFEEAIRNHRRQVRIRIVCIVAVLAIVVLALNIYIGSRTYETYGILRSWDGNETVDSRYYRFGEGMLVYSDDGISYISDDTTHWNQAFEMKEPIVDICEDTVAVCDAQSTVVYIYNTEGLEGEIETVYPIVDLEVSSQGVVAAITVQKETNLIEVIDKEGNEIATGQTYVTGEGCPINISISNDGTKLVASYIYVDGGEAKCKVVFYNYSEIGKNEVGRIVGGFNHYGTSIVSRVEFLDNDTVAAYGENIISLYSIKEKPSIIEEIECDKEINSIFFSEEYIGAVLDNEDYDNPYTVKVYNLEGEEELDKDTDFRYDKIFIVKDSIVFSNESELMLVNMSGRQRYKGEITEGIADIVVTDKVDEYYIINNDREIMQIKLD